MIVTDEPFTAILAAVFLVSSVLINKCSYQARPLIDSAQVEADAGDTPAPGN